MVSTVGADDDAFQPYRNRLHSFKDSLTYLHKNQYLANIGFFHKTNETSDEVLRYEVDRRSAATHRRPPQSVAIPHIK